MKYKKHKAEKRTRTMQDSLKIAAGLVLLVLLSLAFLLCHDIITQSNYFRTKNLIVSGAQRLSVKQILAQAQIHNDMNILAVNIAIARKKLLAHPWIAEARIEREIPDQIHITITEHQPLAIVDLGRKFLMNASGIIFKEMEASDPSELPIITGLGYSDINIKDKNRSRVKPSAVRNTSQQSRSYPFDAVMDVLRLGQPPDCILPNRLIKKIRVDREIGLTVYASGTAREIKLGYHDFSQKYRVLKKILLFLSDGKLKAFSDFDSIDLNNLNRVVLHPSGTQSPAKDRKEA